MQEVRVEGPRKILVTSIYEGGGEVWEKTRPPHLSPCHLDAALDVDLGPVRGVQPLVACALVELSDPRAAAPEPAEEPSEQSHAQVLPPFGCGD